MAAKHLKPYQYQPKERAMAKLQGEPQYFTGRPCKHGHLDFRCTSSGSCMTCSRSMQAKSRAKRLEKEPDYWKNRYAMNPQKFRDNSQKWRKNNPDKFRESQRRCAINGRARRTATQIARQAMKIQATPSWLTKEHRKHIELFYEMSKRTTEQCGYKCNVDHIVPLKGKNVCGLHVPWNLRVVSAAYNSKKRNNMDDGVELPPVGVGVISVEKSALPWNWRK